jgi:hypothetical protein
MCARYIASNAPSDCGHGRASNDMPANDLMPVFLCTGDTVEDSSTTIG